MIIGEGRDILDLSLSDLTTTISEISNHAGIEHV